MKITSLPETGGLAQLAIVRALASKAGVGSQGTIAKEIASPRVQRLVTKAPVSGLSTDDPEALVDQGVIVSAFVSLLRHRSVFYRMLSDKMLMRAAFNTRIQVVTAGATLWIVGEGLPVPLSSLDIGAAALVPKQACSIVVMTTELLKSRYAEQTVSRELRRAVTATVDADFLSTMVDGAPSIVGQTWSDVEDIVVDIRALLEKVEPTSESRLMLVASPSNIRAVASAMGIAGSPAFPGMSIDGGSLWGITAMPSDEIEADTVALIDGARVAAEGDLIQVDAAGSATVEMLDAALVQDATTGTGTSLVSMFQTNSVAIRAIARFGALKTAENAVAVLTNASWGGEVPAS